MKKALLTVAIIATFGCTSPVVHHENATAEHAQPAPQQNMTIAKNTFHDLDQDADRDPSSTSHFRQKYFSHWSAQRRNQRRRNLRKLKPLQVLQTLAGRRRLAADVDASTTAPQPTSPFVDSFTAPQIQNCLVAACGPNNQNWSAYNIMNRPGYKVGDVTPAIDSLWQSEFQSQFMTDSTEIVQGVTAQANRLESVLAKGVKIRSSSPMVPFLKAAAAAAPLTDNLENYLNVDQVGGTITLNEPALMAARGLSAAQQGAAKVLIQTVFIPILLADAGRSQLDSELTSRLKSKYPGVKPAQALMVDATLISHAKDQVSAQTGAMLAHLLFESSSVAVLQKAMTGTDLNAAEADKYCDLATSIEFAGAVFLDGALSDALKAIPFDGNAETQKLIALQAPKLLKQAIGDDATKIAALNLAGSTECRAMLSASTELNASPLRYRLILQIVDDIKKAAKAAVIPLVDPASLAAAQSAIDAVQFTSPTTNQQRIQTIRDGFVAEADNNNSVHELLATPGQDADELTELVTIMQSSSKTWVDDEFKSKVVEACDALPVDSISDFTLTSSGRIALSWYSANYPDLGVSILAHEMGHMVSQILRTQQLMGASDARFSQVRDCVANRNPYLVQPKAIADMEQSTWLEEDWADRFSSLTLAEMSRTGSQWFSKENMGCALLQNDGSSYAANTMAPAANDPHSSGLLRTLMIGFDRKSLPQACQPLMTFAVKGNRQLICE